MIGVGETWTDFAGIVRPVPQVRGRLRFGKCPGHRALRAFVFERDGHACKRCGARDPEGRLVADHIVSRRNGGTHHPRNLQTLCERCNATKANTEDRQGVPT